MLTTKGIRLVENIIFNSFDDIICRVILLAHLAAMEGHLPCLKFIISVTRDIPALLGARNDQGDTPKSLAEQFFKESC